MKKATHYLLLLGILSGGLPTLYCQIPQKKDVTLEDYDRWHQLFTNKCSDQGNWISYTHHYESNSDTLFVKNTHTLKTFAFSKGFNPTFIAESKIILQQKGNQLTIFDLEQESIKQLQHVMDYELSKNERYIASTKVRQGTKALLITDTNGQMVLEVPHVCYWKMNPDHTKLAYITEAAIASSIHIIDFENKLKTTKVLEKAAPLRQLKWNAPGNAFIFISPKNTHLQETSRGTVYAYNTLTQKLAALHVNEDPVAKNTHAISEDYSTEMAVSDDGKRVFFGLDETVNRPFPNPSSVQIWNTADQSIYPGKIGMNDFRRRAVVEVWWPETGKTLQITDLTHPFLQLDAKLKYAITYNPLQYEPQFKYKGDRDYYITHLETGQKKLFLKGASGEPSDLIAAPDGTLLLYYKEHAWWSYNLASEQHICLTKNIKLVKDEKEEANLSGDVLASRVAGFSLNDKEVFIYDTYDIWNVSTDGTSCENITNGRASKTRFRIAPIAQTKVQQIRYDGYQASQMDMSNLVYFKSWNLDTQENGLFSYKRGTLTQPILVKNKYITEIILSKNHKTIVYTEEDSDSPPQIVVHHAYEPKEKIVHQSNPQQKEFAVGKSALFSFDVEGTLVKGVLLYPSNYDPQKKYPMIVHVYEKQTFYLHAYQSPSLQDSAGFNTANYTTQGYFVCLPDMLFEIGNTGQVATKCINNAVQSIIEQDLIDTERIGLIGHSYGGYETNFIATQKNPFKTAVSGASYSDLAADYLHIAWDFKTEDYSRFEYAQMRMGSTLFEDPKRYHKNSPMLLAQGVSIPLLLWAGAEDRHVDVNHSYKFHMALRRLKKENVLLIYPGERHTIENPKNQIDLNIRIKEWFDYYLKNGDRKAWMEPNFLEN